MDKFDKEIEMRAKLEHAKKEKEKKKQEAITKKREAIQEEIQNRKSRDF